MQILQRKDEETKELDSKLKKYLERMEKAEELKHSYISEKMSRTHHHLERVEELKKKHINDRSHQASPKSSHLKSLTNKYERSKKLEQDIEAKKLKIRMERMAKEERAHNVLLTKNKEERERIKSLK